MTTYDKLLALKRRRGIGTVGDNPASVIFNAARVGPRGRLWGFASFSFLEPELARSTYTKSTAPAICAAPRSATS